MKSLQAYGFVFIAVCFVCLACLIVPLQKANDSDVLFGIYCLLLFSLSFGPNLTTYILPAQVYPKKVRTTFNGLSAASGKLGAFTGVYLYGAIAKVSSYSVVMLISAAVAMFGFYISLVYITPEEGGVPNKGDMGEGMENDDGPSALEVGGEGEGIAEEDKDKLLLNMVS